MAPPPAKLTLRALKSKPRPLSEFTEPLWAVLADATRATLRALPAAGTSYEELYRACETLCGTPQFAPTLHARAAAIVREECDALIERLPSASNGPTTGSGLLEALVAGWAALAQRVALVSLVYTPLERGWALQAGAPRLPDVLRQHIHARLLEPARTGLLAALTARVVDRYTLLRDAAEADGVLRQAVHLFVDADLFRSPLQRVLLDASALYFAGDAAAPAASAASTEEGWRPLAAYLAHVAARLAGERRVLAAHVPEAARQAVEPALLRLLHAEYVRAHAPNIVGGNALGALLRELLGADGGDVASSSEALAQLRALHELLGATQQRELLQRRFAEVLREAAGALVGTSSGTTAATAGEEASRLVPRLLALKLRADRCVRAALGGEDGFGRAVRESLGAAINARAQHVAECLAKHADLLLRGQAGPEAEEESVDGGPLMDRLLALFKLVQGKDVFEEFYKAQLAKRLLLNKSVSVDAERLMLAKLKAECGAGFTARLEGMFKDMDVSADLMRAFAAAATAGGEPELATEVSVLTSGFWPTYPAGPEAWNMLPQMRAAQAAYTRYYGAKHGGRSLQWQNALGHCVVRASFPRGNKELHVSAAQALVLDCFAQPHVARLSAAEIRARTNIEWKELARTLQSLALGKVRVLHKSTRAREVAEGDEFRVNDDFEHKLFRIKINTIQIRETVEENTQTLENVFQNRIMAVDAAIVRIMKARKTLKAQALMTELFGQLKFPAQASDLKTRIDHLIELDYMERDKDDRALYHYVA